jgi:DNA gyrase/topoisomerase IV subunit A
MSKQELFGLKVAFFAETTSKLLIFAANGRCYTIEAAKLPGGRGHGEPIRLFIDLEDLVSVASRQSCRPDISNNILCRPDALRSPSPRFTAAW